MRIVISAPRQTVWDIALQSMGTCEAVFEILALNTNLRPDTELEEGTQVFVPDLPTKPLVAAYFASNEIKPVSGIAQL